MLGDKSILPTNEKAVFVFTNLTLILATRLPDTLPLEQQRGAILVCLGNVQCEEGWVGSGG